MNRDDQRLEELTDAVLDGTDVDWHAAETSVPEDVRDVVRQLHLVAQVGRVSRTDDPLDAIERAGVWRGFTLRGRLGRGSFGVTYRALDRHLDREVALKLLPDRQSHVPAAEIIEEARLLARVQHPNVAAVYSSDREDGCVGIAMELVQGRTLAQIVRDTGPLSAAEASLVGASVCRGLAAIHQANIVHRDVKAHNVMRSEGGRVVITDFGAGRETSYPASSNELAGTPLYLAPELLNGGVATPLSDLYSVGVLLFWLVSGTYPIEADSFAAVREAHRTGSRCRLRDARPDLPSRFIEVVERALSPNPRERYATAGELEAALLAIQPAPATAPAVPTHSPRRFLALGMVAAIVTAVVVGSVSLRRHFAPAQGPPGSPAAGATAVAAVEQTTLSAQRVSMPATMFVGRASHDGRYLSYVDVNGDLCLQDLTTGETRPLTNKGQTEEYAESQMAMSFDGMSVAYTWHTLDGTNEIRVIGQDGKWPRVLLRRSDVQFPSPLQWSADGTELLAMLELTDNRSQLALISPKSGAVRAVRSFAPGEYHPALSPDGNFIAFDQAQQSDPRARDIFVMTADGADLHPVVEHPSNDLFPVWAPGGRLLFVSDRTGTLGVWSVNLDRGRALDEAQLLVRDVGRLAMPLGLTGEGALYYYLQNGMVDVYSQAVDLSGDTQTNRPKAVSTTRVGANNSSAWSPDGRFLAYMSMPGSVQNDRYSRMLSILDQGTGVQRDLRLPLSFFIEPRWSPDGATILVNGIDLRQHAGFFAVDVASGTTRGMFAFPQGEVPSAAFDWSPDGSAIWYDKHGAIVAHNLATGHEDTVVDYTGESIQRIMQWPGFRISPDRASIAYTGFTYEHNTGGSVVKVRRLGEPSREIARATMPERVEFQDWTPDGGGVLLIRRNGTDRQAMLYEVRLDGTGSHPLGVSMEGLRDVNLRTDGTTLTYTAGANLLEVWVLKNFLPGWPR